MTINRFGFRLGRVTMHMVFILRQVQENILEGTSKSHCTFRIWRKLLILYVYSKGGCLLQFEGKECYRANSANS